MYSFAATHARLMHESEKRVQAAARAADPRERVVALRVIDNARAWQAWEAEHSVAMRRVAASRRSDAQSHELKKLSFALVHRVALFDYFTERKPTIEQRRRLLREFHGPRAYIDAMVGEHGNYVRAACSYYCAGHLGNVVLRDGSCGPPLERYESLYREYFDAFCDSVVGDPNDPQLEADRALLPYLKHQAMRLRNAILSLPRSEPLLEREIEIRARTGTTQRVPRLPTDR